VAAGNLLNISFIDPAFDTEGNGTSADDHPLANAATWTTPCSS
jgi:phospholipase C